MAVHQLEWYTLTDDRGAEHYVAESGWLLARIQRGPGSKGWDWCVATTRGFADRGEFPDDDTCEQAKAACERAVNEVYLRTARRMSTRRP